MSHLVKHHCRKIGYKLAEKADTPEARQRLENIGKSLHHRSEAIVGME